MIGVLLEQLCGVLQIPADKKKKRAPTLVETKKQDVSVPDVTELRDTPLGGAAPVSQTAAASTGVHTRRSAPASGAGADGTTTIS